MTSNEIVRKINQLKELQGFVSEINDEIESIKDQLKAELGDSSVLEVGGFKISNVLVTSNRIDTTAFKSKYPEIASQFTVVSEYKRFSIT